MVHDTGVPVQLSVTGVMVTVDVMGADVVLVAVNEGILPEPWVVRPIPGLLLVHK